MSITSTAATIFLEEVEKTVGKKKNCSSEKKNYSSEKKICSSEKKSCSREKSFHTFAT